MTVTCCIPFCGRMTNGTGDDVICSKCWQHVTKRTKQDHRRLMRRYRRVDTTMRQMQQLDPYRWKPGVIRQAQRLETLFHKRFATVVDRCKQEIMGI